MKEATFKENLELLQDNQIKGLMFSKISPLQFEELINVLANNTSLKLLFFNGFPISDENAKKLGQVLRDNKNITKIEFNANTMSDAAAEAILSGLKDNKAIVNLSIFPFPPGVKGVSSIDYAKSVKELLSHNHTLEVLDLRRNGLYDAGIDEIAQGLKQNTTLRRLNLAMNHIKDAGAASIAEALKVNTSLLSLNCAYNHIKNEGAIAIAEALKVNKTLQSLNLDGFGDMRSDAGVAMANALKVNTTLSKLKFFSQGMRERGGNAVLQSLATNFSLTKLRFYSLAIEQLQHCFMENPIKKPIKRNREIANLLASAQYPNIELRNELINLLNQKVPDQLIPEPETPPSQTVPHALTVPSLQDLSSNELLKKLTHNGQVDPDNLFSTVDEIIHRVSKPQAAYQLLISTLRGVKGLHKLGLFQNKDQSKANNNTWEIKNASTANKI